MSGDLPEGVEVADVENHAITLRVAGELINATSRYLGSAADTPEEVLAERMLNALAERLASSETMAGSVLLCLASALVNTADNDLLQAWFNEQAARVNAVLGDG